MSYINGYPLVNIQKAIENCHTNSGFTQLENGDFPVRYVNVYQRVVGYFFTNL